MENKDTKLSLVDQIAELGQKAKNGELEKQTTIYETVPVSIKSIDDENRTIEVIASTDSNDRHGEVLLQSGWFLDNFLKNPIILWSHDRWSPPVAQALAVKVEDNNGDGKSSMTMTIKFATAEEYEFADTIYKLYKGGYLRAFSVGLIPLKWNDNWTVVLESELLELSCVTIPANQDALVLAFNEGVITRKEAGFMVKTMETQLKALTSVLASKDNQVMDEKSVDKLASAIESLAKGQEAILAELKSAKKSDEETPTDTPSDDDTVTPTPSDTPSAEDEDKPNGESEDKPSDDDLDGGADDDDPEVDLDEELDEETAERVSKGVQAHLEREVLGKVV